MKYANIKKHKSAPFKEVTGVTPRTFQVMLEVIKTAYTEAHKNRRRHRKLSCEDMLLMTLEYSNLIIHCHNIQPKFF